VGTTTTTARRDLVERRLECSLEACRGEVEKLRPRVVGAAVPEPPDGVLDMVDLVADVPPQNIERGLSS
jgi:hypothetical protein